MEPDNKPLLKWFGYSRRERRSSFILLILLFVVISVRFIIPERELQIRDISSFPSVTSTAVSGLSSRVRDSSELFRFNPNTAPFDTLILLGLSAKQAGTLISYRNKGGSFNNAGDLRKVYGMEETNVARLEPFAEFGMEQDTGKKVTRARRGSLPDRKIRARVDLNKCDSAALEALPGLGPVLSARIIRYRKLLGGFATPEQLREVYGLTGETYDLISPVVFADSSDINKISINEATFTGSFRHPYLERYDIQSLMKYRELRGKIVNVSELVENGILTQETARKISPYLAF